MTVPMSAWDADWVSRPVLARAEGADVATGPTPFCDRL
jgi:hypothetical protein